MHRQVGLRSQYRTRSSKTRLFVFSPKERRSGSGGRDLATHKPTAKKRRLARRQRMRKSVPSWVIAKTRGRVRSHPKKKNWRESRLKA
ncbi:hypothetical protein [[Eubacterium] cellulosolvens]